MRSDPCRADAPEEGGTFMKRSCMQIRGGAPFKYPQVAHQARFTLIRNEYCSCYVYLPASAAPISHFIEEDDFLYLKLEEGNLKFEFKSAPAPPAATLNGCLHFERIRNNIIYLKIQLRNIQL